MTVTLPLPNNRDRMALEGYFVYRNGSIKKVLEKVPNKSIGQVLDNFSVKCSHAIIEKKEIAKVYALDEPMSTIANSKNLIFLYEVGGDQDVEFHLQVLDSQTKELLSFTRRIYSKSVQSQEEL